MDVDAFLLFVAIGLCAQLVDGALGMAYGVISNTALLALGLPPAMASTAVHTAEVVTSGISGGSHALFGNVDRRLFLRLAIPGAIGGVCGGLLLGQVSAHVIKPLVLTYLMVIGVLLLMHSAGYLRRPREARHPAGLGFFAGTLDAIGGGGWGPIATTTLLAHGHPARTTIGSVDAAEFVVTVAISVTLLGQLGFQHPEIVSGLLVGGAIAAPIAARLVGRLPERVILTLVGGLVLATSAFELAML
jgi:uncharacterized membrane protein YfcA